MKTLRILLLLPLLVAAKAFPQKVVSQELYNVVVSDTASYFYRCPDYESVGSPKTPVGEYTFPFDRIITSDGDTIVCFVKVGTPSRDPRKMVWASLEAEDQRSYNLREDGKLFGGHFRGEVVNKGGKNLKQHYRIKVRAYQAYFPGSFIAYPLEFGNKPFSKRVTAYIDYFPFFPWQSRVRYKVKNVRLHSGPKYDVFMLGEEWNRRAYLAKRDSVYSRQRAAFEKKYLKWVKRYAKKYRPDQLEFYERLDSLKKKAD